MKRMKTKKSILAASVLVLVLSVTYFAGSKIAMGSIESHAEESSKETLKKRSDSEKDIVSESDSFLQTSKQFAQELLDEHADLPLLDEYADEHWGDSSLENIMNDINAGDGAKEAILTVCKNNHINAEKASVSDLTEEQIIWIDQEVFRNSDHPL